MPTKTFAVIVGSLRKGAYSRQIATALIAMAPAGLKGEIVEIGDLPLYNPDLDEGTPPPAWTAFREKMQGFDAVLFITPEYNRSYPAAIKNALDVGSRPYGHSIWSGKPGAVVSVSPGAVGGFGANHHLRQPLVFLDVRTMQQPEVYLGHVNAALDEGGKITNPDTEKFLRGFMEKYAGWVSLILA